MICVYSVIAPGGLGGFSFLMEDVYCHKVPDEGHKGDNESCLDSGDNTEKTVNMYGSRGGGEIKDDKINCADAGEHVRQLYELAADDRKNDTDHTKENSNYGDIKSISGKGH